MIVVADASPLRYLILIEHTHILPLLSVAPGAGRRAASDAVVELCDLLHTVSRKTVQLRPHTTRAYA